MRIEAQNPANNLHFRTLLTPRVGLWFEGRFQTRLSRQESFKTTILLKICIGFVARLATASL